MSNTCCGCSTERVAGIVIVAGLALCIGAWVQPRSVVADQDRVLPDIDPASMPRTAGTIEDNSAVEDLSGETPELGSERTARTLSVASTKTSLPRVGDADSQRMFFELPDSTTPGRVLTISGGGEIETSSEVLEGTLAADFDGDGILDEADMLDFAAAYDLGDLRADRTGDGFVDSDDFADFADSFETGRRNPLTLITELVYRVGGTTGESGSAGEVRAKVLRFAGQTATITIDGHSITIGGQGDGNTP